MLTAVTRLLCARWLLPALLLCSLEARAVDWPMLNFPSGAVVEPMTGKLRHNGYHARFLRFTVDQPQGQVLQFFQNSWKASKPVAARLADWQVLTKKEGPFITTVELQAELANRTQGVVAVRLMQDIRAASDSVPDDVPIYSSASITSTLESEDGARKAVTITLVAPVPARTLHQFYARELARRGWKTAENQQGPRNNPMHMVFIDKAGRSGMVQSTESGGATRCIIHIDNGS